MERYSEVIGRPVICIEDGKKVGIVKDIIFKPKYKEVSAFLLEKKGYEIKKCIIPLKDISSIGNDAVIINDRKCIMPLRKAEDNNGMNDKGIIKGLKIYSKSGEDLGVVEDVLFDCKTGLVEGVVVSDGLLQDLLKGRTILPLFGKVEFSDENILVDREAVEEMTSTGGGIRKKFMGEE